MIKEIHENIFAYSKNGSISIFKYEKDNLEIEKDYEVYI